LSDPAPAQQEPSAAPRGRRIPTPWIVWGVVGLGVSLMGTHRGFVPGQSLLLLGGLALLTTFLAVRLYPRGCVTFRRRWPWLLLLAAPPLVSVACGPLGLVAASRDAARQAWMQQIQYGTLIASLSLALVLTVALREARAFTALVAALSVLACLVLVSVSSLIIAPGS
jgi:hypothetical protein